jgi:flagellar protein FlaF
VGNPPAAFSFLPCRFRYHLKPREAIIRNATTQYQKIANAAHTGGDSERAAFNMIIRELENCTPGTSRVRALGRNHTLWSVLVRDLALEENRLPEGIKAQLISLGLWSMRYSTNAMLKDLPLTPLLEVNRNVVSGLAAQRANAESGAGKAPPSDQAWKAPHSA